MNSRFQSAFTLIEILVVIAIISILSGVLYASFGTAREDTRNKAVRTELKETQLALELYKAQNGHYPPAPTGPTNGTNPCVVRSGSEYQVRSKYCVTGFSYISDLAPAYIAKLPSHTTSQNSNCNIVYRTDNSNNSWYKLTAVNCHAGATSASTGVQTDDELARCSSTCGTAGVCDPASADFYQSYAVYSKGGECKP